MEPEFDWLAYGLGVISSLFLALLLRWRFVRRRPTLGRLPTRPVSVPPALQAKVRLMRAQGQELQAIKIVRKATGCDLQSARDAVMSLR